jgi:hypothetical protein
MLVSPSRRVLVTLFRRALSSFETLFRISKPANCDLDYLRDGRNAQTVFQVFKNALVFFGGAKAERRFLFRHEPDSITVVLLRQGKKL